MHIVVFDSVTHRILILVSLGAVVPPFSSTMFNHASWLFFNALALTVTIVRSALFNVVLLSEISSLESFFWWFFKDSHAVNLIWLREPFSIHQ